MANKYFKVWWLLTIKSAQTAFESRFGSIIFFLGKIIRIVLMLVFIIVVVSKTKQIAGYNIWQVIFFYATFNLIDTIPQLLMREVYRFRSYVITGDFDYFLIKPLSPLFRVMFGGADVLDSFVILIAIGLLIFSSSNIPGITATGVLLYILLILNTMLIAGAIHIAISALGIITTEVDSALWIYRDLTSMGRFPVEIYRDPVSFFITYVVPVGIMISFPAKAILGILSTTSFIAAFLVGGVLLVLSLYFWRYALSQYSSASS